MTKLDLSLLLRIRSHGYTMRPIFLCTLIYSVLFSLPSFSVEIKKNDSNVAQERRIVILGDSLTEGYGVTKEAAFPAILEKKMNQQAQKKWKIVNAGVSGSTTASAISRMKWQLKSNPEYMFIALGANDGLRGLDVKTSEKNLAEAIEFAQKSNVKVILGGLYMPPNYGKKYTEDFAKMYSGLAKKYKVIFIPFILDKVAGDPKYNLADGIHPNEKGHQIIAETIFTALKEKL